MTTPQTAAGRPFDGATSRALFLEADIRWPDEHTRLARPFVDELLTAIEAEARAAALDEARAAVEACNIAIVWYNDRTPIAAIDALRERSGE